MPDISYTRSFTHTDWIDGESIVQASGPDGFNARFHACEAEFTAIGTVFGQVNTALKNVQQLRFLSSQAPITITANSSSIDYQVEDYDRSTLPPNIDKPYFCVISPTAASTLNVFHTFAYRQLPGNKVRVTVAFYNPTSQPVSFGFRILSLSDQVS